MMRQEIVLRQVSDLTKFSLSIQVSAGVFTELIEGCRNMIKSMTSSQPSLIGPLTQIRITHADQQKNHVRRFSESVAQKHLAIAERGVHGWITLYHLYAMELHL